MSGFKTSKLEIKTVRREATSVHAVGKKYNIRPTIGFSSLSVACDGTVKCDG
jgi:hypothetical protein